MQLRRFAPFLSVSVVQTDTRRMIRYHRALLAILIDLLVVSILCECEAEQATDKTTKVGDYVVLNCDIDFPQGIIIPHELQWRKDGTLIFSWTNGVPEFDENFVNRVSLLSETDAWQRGRGSVNITNIRETDEGWYECKVIFPNRTPSSTPNGTWFHLLVEGGNLLSVPPINGTTLEGDTVDLKCASKNPSAVVMWYKNNVPVFEIPELRQRTEILPGGSLRILSTEMEDSGYYACEVSNEEGKKQAAGAYLNVQYKAKVIYAPKRVFLPFGKPGMLDCFYKANPEITKIRWEKDGFLFDAYNVPGVFARKNGSLYFGKVDDSHAGEYTCTPYNDLGTNGASPRMQVVVQKTPIFSIAPHVLYLRKAGESITMHCGARDGQDYEPPKITWSKKGGEISQNRMSVMEGNLTIIGIQMSDRGTYVCKATNEAATITSESELLVEEGVKTHAPYNVTADVTKDSVTVKWLAGYARPKLKFSVWYRSNDSQNWRMIELNNEMYEARIQDLAPGETYEVMVLSQNEQGDGMFSKTVQITTKREESTINLAEEVEGELDREFRSPVGLYQQIGPPTDLYIEVVEGGYKLTWKPPKHGAEMLRYYTVIWSKMPIEDRIGVIETNSDSAIVRNLEEQKIYKFQVLAMSTNDYEAPSQKYIYHVPAFPIKKPLLIGVIGGAFSITVVLSLLWYCIKPSRMTA